MRWPRWDWLGRALGRTAMPIHLATGRWGERQAGRWLERSGYRILGRRVRMGRRGELDIVARHGNCLVFVEVKTRRNEDFVRPAAAVDRAKRRNLRRAASHYMARLNQPPDTFRFDVLEVIGRPGDRRPTVRHIRNAFTMDRRYRPR
jgi:putative endonuclease